MKKVISRSLVLLMVLTSVLFAAPAPAALAAAPSAAQVIYPLTDLGANGDIVMRGPYETTSLRFALPPTWALQQGVNLLLSISTFVDTGASQNATGTNAVSGALLDVYFNGRLQQSLPLSTGESLIYNVPVAVDALASPYADGRYQITFSLDASYDCRIAQHTTIKIAGTSQAVLPYAQVALPLNLHRLPWPIYQTRAQHPGPAALVMPAQPTASQLNAALLVMAGFGRMTNSQLPIKMVTADKLTENDRTTSDLIFVGPASAFPMLAGINLPVGIQAKNFAAPAMQVDDGVVQLAPSAWNNEKTILVVGGNTDAGIVKAAQAFTTANLVTAVAPTYSIVASVNPAVQTGLLNATPSGGTFDYKLSDLGYAISTNSGIGTGWFSYDFVIPTGEVASTGAYLNLMYSYSSLVDTNLSSADVYLNSERVASINIDPDHPNSASAQIPLPLSIMRPGRNTIEIAAGLLPKDSCSAFSANDLWMTVFPDSILHLPLAPATPTTGIAQDIKSYPKPFTDDPALNAAAFVVPQNDAQAWAVAGQVAYNLGAQATGSALGFETAFDGQVPDEMHGRDLILVGLPTELPILSNFKDVLPAYFDKGSNIAVLQSQEVVYRVPEGKDLGYLELFNSTWNNQRTVLLVAGTSGAGTASAGTALTTVATRDNLRGNFVTVDGQATTVVDTRTGLGLGSLPPVTGLTTQATGSQPVVTPGNGEDAVRAAARQRQIILMGTVVILVLMVVMGVLAILLRRRGQGRSG